MHLQLDYHDIVPRQTSGGSAVNTPALVGTTVVAVTDPATILSGISVAVENKFG